jgi:hypothetical protein
LSAEADALVALPDDALLDRLQRGAFAYLSRLLQSREWTRRRYLASRIAEQHRRRRVRLVVLSGCRRTRLDVACRVRGANLEHLAFFRNSPQNDRPDATGYKGFYYHFLDMGSGKRVWNCELSLVDSTLLIAGILTAACYFDGGGSEAEIRALSNELYQRVDWRWAQHEHRTVSQGWKPECGFLHYGWEGYNEATIVYALGLGSPTNPLSTESFAGWTATYQWENLLGQDVLYSGPLFTHLFSHAWVDYRGIRDAFMREKNSDYFENTRRSIEIHREYGARNPRGYEGYDATCGGLPRATVRAIESCAKAVGTAAFSATCRAAHPTDRMTERSHLGRCSLPSRSTPTLRCAERVICCAPIRRSAFEIGSAAASIRPWPTAATSGCPKDGSGSIRDCWS